MPIDFVTALEAGDIEAIRRIPKADLHIHGFGGGDRAFVHERTGVDVAPVDGVMRSMAEMHAFVQEKLSNAFAGTAGRALALDATFVQARKDGVTRLEVGEDAWSITHHRGSARALWYMLEQAHRDGGPEIDWIPQLGISRRCDIVAIDRRGDAASRTWMFQNAGPFRG